MPLRQKKKKTLGPIKLLAYKGPLDTLLSTTKGVLLWTVWHKVLRAQLCLGTKTSKRPQPLFDFIGIIFCKPKRGLSPREIASLSVLLA